MKEVNMAFCRHCGVEVHDDAIVCVKCGRGLLASPLTPPAPEKKKETSSTFIAGGL
jgi:hypothetical protein